jgi:23S rRNA (uracil1939-C5)-methyltransferase
MVKRGDEIRLKVDDAAFEGRSVGRVEGFVVFIDGAVPGDVVTARVLRTKKNYAEAKVVAVEQPSPFRVGPRCKHFGVCGGCRWQHVDYQVQLRFKQQHVVDAFERIGGFRDLSILPIIGSNEIYFYRNKMEFSFSDQQWRLNNPGPRTRAPEAHQPSAENSQLFLGLHVPQRYDKVLDIEECHLQSDISNRILGFVRSFARRRNLPAYSSKKDAGYLRFLVIRQSERTQEFLVNLVTYDDRPDVMREFATQLLEAIPEITTVVNTINSRKAQVAFGDRETVYIGEGVIHERLGNHVFTISASSFFQTNTAQTEKLYEVARSFAELKGGEVVWDLYSGTGSIALFVSDAAREVVGIESVASSVKDAQRNAEENGVRNCAFILGDLKDRLTTETDWMARHEKPDVMIVDPPRSGMHPKVVEEIIALAPPRIVYVSCNPATQARDVKALCAEKYALVKLQPVDLFPHTYHVENVAQLDLR